jgi:cytoskeletal protein RodZ
MLSSFTWLALLQPTLSIIIGLVFLVTAFLCLSLMKPRRKTAPLLQGTGFLLLAVPYILTFTGFFTPAITSPVILIAALLIVSGFIINRLHIASTITAKPESVIQAKVASVMQTASPHLPTESAIKPKQPSTPPVNPAPPAPKPTPTSMARTAISAKSGLRSEPLVKLPALKRKRARQFVNFLIGFLVFFLIGWGSYVIAKRIIQPPASLNTSSFNDAKPSTSLLPTVSQPEASPLEESPSSNPSTSPTPSPSDKPVGDTVTIKDTETGYLNVREGASTASKIITTIDPGATYPLLDTSTNGDWYKIELDDGNAGWISTKYTEKKSAE